MLHRSNEVLDPVGGTQQVAVLVAKGAVNDHLLAGLLILAPWAFGAYEPLILLLLARR
jgi:hypothetical protein